MPRTPKNDAPIATPDPLTLKTALDSKRVQLARMSAAEVGRTPGLDAATAAGVVIGSLPRIAKHREAIETQFGAEGVAYFDDLAAVAYAAQQAHVELTAADSASDLSEMHGKLAEDHELLVTDADALANRKLIDRARVDQGRSTQGYRTTVTSTLVLIALFREHWSTVAGKTPLTVAELDRIERDAQKMLQRINEREQGSSRLPAAELRTRAMSMLVKVYGEVRRMLSYVRWWEEDADSIAPSLWSGRRGKSRSGATEPAIDEDVVDPLDPVIPVPLGPNNGGGPFAT